MWFFYPSLHLLPYSQWLTNSVPSGLLKRSVILGFCPLQLPSHSMGPSLTSWMDLWSDDLAHLLRSVPGQPKAINVVRACGMFLVVSHSNQSVPSSSMPLPLYIHASFLLIFNFWNKSSIRALSSTLSTLPPIYFINYAFRLLGATVSHTLLFSSTGKYFYVEFSCKLFKFSSFVIYVNSLESQRFFVTCR